MAMKILLPFDWLNLASLSREERDKVFQKCKMLTTKTVEIFEYEKNNDWYSDGAELHHQMITKALFITKAFYTGYSFFFSLRIQ